MTEEVVVKTSDLVAVAVMALRLRGVVELAEQSGQTGDVVDEFLDEVERLIPEPERSALLTVDRRNRRLAGRLQPARIEFHA